MKEKILGVVLSFLVISALLFSGCSEEKPDPETDWDGLISSYNPEECEFKNYFSMVTIEDKVVEAENYNSATKFILQSNKDVPVYLTETHEYEDKGPYLASNYDYEDIITFTVKIREDEHGEYITELKE